MALSAHRAAVGLPVAGRWEPQMTATLLPGCNCGAPHPLALKPPVDSPTCLICEAPVGRPGETIDVAAQGGAWLWVANTLHRFAKWLLALAERL